MVVANLLELELEAFHRERRDVRPTEDADALLEEIASLQTLAYLLSANRRILEFPEE